MRNRIDPTEGVFDDTHYASSISEIILRSFQLGPKYFLWAVPRYFCFRRRLALPPWDPAVLTNPLREFGRRAYADFPLPPHFSKALALLAETGARLSMTRVRVEAQAAAWWKARSAIGDAIECGSFTGATSLLLALLGRLNGVRQRVLMLDTFAGMPEPSGYDPFRAAGEYRLGNDQVAIIRRRAKMLKIGDRIDVRPGLFSETFVRLRRRVRQFAFVHIDANLYQSTFEACKFAIPRTSRGGLIVFDDYNAVCDLGARLAIDQYLSGTRLRPLPLASAAAYVQIP